MNISMNKKQSYWLHYTILINPQVFLLCVDFFDICQLIFQNTRLNFLIKKKVLWRHVHIHNTFSVVRFSSNTYFECILLRIHRFKLYASKIAFLLMCNNLLLKTECAQIQEVNKL